MDRKVYNECMRPYISGQHEDRKMDFCIGAKRCSGKAQTQEDAKKLCLEAALNPKQPKVKRDMKSRKCVITPDMAACIIENLGGSEITQGNLVAAITKCTTK